MTIVCASPQSPNKVTLDWYWSQDLKVELVMPIVLTPATIQTMPRPTERLPR